MFESIAVVVVVLSQGTAEASIRRKENVYG